MAWPDAVAGALYRGLSVGSSKLSSMLDMKQVLERRGVKGAAQRPHAERSPQGERRTGEDGRGLPRPLTPRSAPILQAAGLVGF